MDEFEKVRHKRLRIILLHLYEMPRRGKFVKTENKSVKAEGLVSGREVVIICKGPQGSLVESRMFL